LLSLKTENIYQSFSHEEHKISSLKSTYMRVELSKYGKIQSLDIHYIQQMLERLSIKETRKVILKRQ